MTGKASSKKDSADEHTGQGNTLRTYFLPDSGRSVQANDAAEALEIAKKEDEQAAKAVKAGDAN